MAFNMLAVLLARLRFWAMLAGAGLFPAVLGAAESASATPDLTGTGFGWLALALFLVAYGFVISEEPRALTRAVGVGHRFGLCRLHLVALSDQRSPAGTPDELSATSFWY